MKNSKTANLTAHQRVTLASVLLLDSGSGFTSNDLAEELSCTYREASNRINALKKKEVVERVAQGRYMVNRDILNLVRVVASNPNKDMIEIMSESKKDWDAAGRPPFAPSPELRMLNRYQMDILLENIHTEIVFYMGQSMFDPSVNDFIQFLEDKQDWMESWIDSKLPEISE